jgi:hypothetical protein
MWRAIQRVESLDVDGVHVCPAEDQEHFAVGLAGRCQVAESKWQMGILLEAMPMVHSRSPSRSSRSVAPSDRPTSVGEPDRSAVTALIQGSGDGENFGLARIVAARTPPT